MRVLLLFSFILLATSGIARNREVLRDWKVARTDGYTVVSDLKDSEVEGLLDDLHYFQLALRIYFPQMESVSPRHFLVALTGQESSFKEFAPMVSARKAMNVAGLHIGSEFNPIIFVKEGDEREQTRSVLYHEYTHMMLTAIHGSFDPWANEGLAELFGSFRREGSTLYIGKVDRNDSSLYLESAGFLKASEFFPLTNAEMQARAKTSREFGWRFYAQAQLLAHYCFFGEKGQKYREAYLKMAILSQSKRVQVEDVQEAFGVSASALVRELERYLRNGKYSYAAIDLTHLDPSSPVEIRTVREDEIVPLVNRFRVRSRRFNEAAVDMAAYDLLNGRDWEWNLTMAESAVGQGRDKDAGAYAWEAIKGGNCNDPYAYVLAVRHVLSGSAPDKDPKDRETMLELKALLGEAYGMGDASLLLFEQYYRVLVDLGDAIEMDDIRLLVAGNRSYPDIEYATDLRNLIERLAREAAATESNPKASSVSASD